MSSTQDGQLITDSMRVFQVSKTVAANSGDAVIATMTGSVLIESVICKTITYHADLTSIVVVGGVSNAVMFINATDGDGGNLNTADKQVAWVGLAEFGNTKTITATFAGTNTGSVTYLFTIKYRPVTAGAGIV